MSESHGSAHRGGPLGFTLSGALLILYYFYSHMALEKKML